MGPLDFSISVKTYLSKERFLNSFSNVEWVENDFKDSGQISMKNKYAYFSIDNNGFEDISFFVHGLINLEDYPKLLEELNKIECGYWIDLTDSDKNLFEQASKNY